MIAELVAKGETVYPLQLGELLEEANALADAQGAAPRTAAAVDPLRMAAVADARFNAFAATFTLDQ